MRRAFSCVTKEGHKYSIIIGERLKAGAVKFEVAFAKHKI